jgi:hypothetical protein
VGLKGPDAIRTRDLRFRNTVRFGRKLLTPFIRAPILGSCGPLNSGHFSRSSVVNWSGNCAGLESSFRVGDELLEIHFIDLNLAPAFTESIQ